MVCSIARTAGVRSRIRSRVSFELSNWARLTSIRVVSSRMAVRATAGRRSRLVVTSCATLSSLVSSVTTLTFSAGVTCSVTAGRFSRSVATWAATSSSRVRSATAWTFSSTVTGRSTRWPTTRFAPSGVHCLAPVRGLNGASSIAVHRSSASATDARMR